MFTGHAPFSPAKLSAPTSFTATTQIAGIGVVAMLQTLRLDDLRQPHPSRRLSRRDFA